MAILSLDHGTEMFAKKEASQLEAIYNMMKTMADPNAIQMWIDKKRKGFDSFPENK